MIPWEENLLSQVKLIKRSAFFKKFLDNSNNCLIYLLNQRYKEFDRSNVWFILKRFHLRLMQLTSTLSIIVNDILEQIFTLCWLKSVNNNAEMRWMKNISQQKYALILYNWEKWTKWRQWRQPFQYSCKILAKMTWPRNKSNIKNLFLDICLSKLFLLSKSKTHHRTKSSSEAWN